MRGSEEGDAVATRRRCEETATAVADGAFVDDGIRARDRRQIAVQTLTFSVKPSLLIRTRAISETSRVLFENAMTDIKSLFRVNSSHEIRNYRIPFTRKVSLYLQLPLRNERICPSGRRPSNAIASPAIQGRFDSETTARQQRDGLASIAMRSSSRNKQA